MHYRISYLLDHTKKTTISIEEALLKTGLSEQELRGHLKDFDYSLHKSDLQLEPINPLEWTERLLGLQQDHLELDIEERQLMIYLMIFAEEDNASVFHFQDFLRVSRGTVLADLKEIRNRIEIDGIEIEYNRRIGYILSGNKNKMVRYAKNAVSTLLQTPAGKFALQHFISQLGISYYAHVRDLIVKYIEASNYELVLSRLDEMIYFTIFSKKSFQSSALTRFEDEEQVQEISLYPMSEGILNEWLGSNIPETNIAMYTIYLLSVLQGNIHEPTFESLLQLSANIIHQMEQHAAIEFQGFRDLLFDVFNHLVPAYYRIKYGLVLSNTLLETIKSEYAALFEITHQALKPLEQATNQPIPDDEIAYFTILFGGALKADNDQPTVTDTIRALIVCPNGVSSSLILESELKQLFPTMEFKGANTTESLKNIPEKDFDVVFSTVPINNIHKKIYVVKPIMSQLKKNQLINEVQKDWLIPGFSFPDASEIIEALKPYMTLKKGVTENQIYKILNRRMTQHFDKQDSQLKLVDLLTEENIVFRKKVSSFEEGIRIAAQPLLERGDISENYIDTMIENVHKRGPYIHMGDGIALPHARPEDGVQKIGFSMLALNEPIALDEAWEYMVDHFIVLAAADNSLHLNALSELSQLIRNKALLKDFLKSREPKQLTNILKKL